MLSWASADLARISLWYFGLAIASAVFPWVNAELLVLSLPAFAKTKMALVLLVLVFTAGQMTGKCVLYWTGRKGNSALPPRFASHLSKWHDRLAARPGKAVLFVFVSSLTGLPPFYVMTLVAGALRMNFPVYVVAGTAGRLVKFAAVVMLPHLAVSLFRPGA